MVFECNQWSFLLWAQTGSFSQVILWHDTGWSWASNCFLCYKLGRCNALISLDPVSCNAECSLREWVSPDLGIRCKRYIPKKKILNSILCSHYHHIKFQVSLTLPSRTYLTLSTNSITLSGCIYLSYMVDITKSPRQFTQSWSHPSHLCHWPRYVWMTNI